MNTIFNSSNPFLAATLHYQLCSNDIKMNNNNLTLNSNTDNNQKEVLLCKNESNLIFSNIKNVYQEEYRDALKSKLQNEEISIVPQIPKNQPKNKKGLNINKNKHDFIDCQEALLGLKKYILFQWNYEIRNEISKNCLKKRKNLKIKHEIDHQGSKKLSNQINDKECSELFKSLGETNMNSKFKQTELSNSSEETTYNKNKLKKRLNPEISYYKHSNCSSIRICGKNYLNSKINIIKNNKSTYSQNSFKEYEKNEYSCRN